MGGISFFLDETATLTRQLSTQDASGGAINTPFATVTTNIPIARWIPTSYMVNTFMRRDVVGDTVLATNMPLNVYPGDVFVIATAPGNGIGYYVVHGVDVYTNMPTLNENLWLYDTSLKTI